MELTAEHRFRITAEIGLPVDSSDRVVAALEAYPGVPKGVPPATAEAWDASTRSGDRGTAVGVALQGCVEHLGADRRELRRWCNMLDMAIRERALYGDRPPTPRPARAPRRAGRGIGD